MINAVHVVQVARSVCVSPRETAPAAEETCDILLSCFTAGRIVEQWDAIVNAC